MRAMIKAEYREAFLEIRQVDPEHKLITGIEILSPLNKRPNTKGWRLYYRKRLAFLSGHANIPTTVRTIKAGWDKIVTDGR